MSIILKNKKLVKSGNQFFFSVDKPYIDNGQVVRDKNYTITIEEEIPIDG